MVLRNESFQDRIPQGSKSFMSAGTQVVIDNQCTTPVCVFLARNAEDPTVKNSIDHSVPAQASYVIRSGWQQDSLATLIVRIGVDEAKIYRMPRMAHLKVEL